MKQLIAITGPTCGGKTTLKQELIRANQGRFVSVTTTTTRMRRSGEENGVDYRFRSEAEFESMLEREAFLEHIKIDGNLYGLEKAELLRACREGKAGVVVVTPEGLSALKVWCDAKKVKLIRVFASAPIDVLHQRLNSRKGKASEQEISTRRRRLDREARNLERDVEYDIYAGENHRAIGERVFRSM